MKARTQLKSIHYLNYCTVRYVSGHVTFGSTVAPTTGPVRYSILINPVPLYSFGRYNTFHSSGSGLRNALMGQIFRWAALDCRQNKKGQLNRMQFELRLLNKCFR